MIQDDGLEFKVELYDLTIRQNIVTARCFLKYISHCGSTASISISLTCKLISQKLITYLDIYNFDINLLTAINK